MRSRSGVSGVSDIKNMSGKCALCPAQDDPYPCSETSCPERYPVCFFCEEEVEYEPIHVLGRDFHPDCAGDLWTALSHRFSYILRGPYGTQGELETGIKASPDMKQRASEDTEQ